MWLLPVGTDHGCRGVAQKDPEAHRQGHRRGHDQHLSVRNLSAHPSCRAHGGQRHIQDLGRPAVKTMIRGKTAKLSRRTFIVGSAAAGGGLALGFNLPSGFDSAVAQSVNEGAEVNAWVVVKPDDTCVIRVARSEMGQGTITGLVQLVAEELECDWSRVKAEQITPGQNLARKRVWGEMSTGGSRGIRTSQDYVRRGGAAARIMLLHAAAEEWKIPVGELTVADGVITHAASRRSLSYGKVAAAAAKLEAPDPKAIKLKDPKDWKIAGKPMKRLDTVDKLDGSKIFAIDVKLPDMLCATIKDCPVFGGKVTSYDETKIAGRPGVRKVVKVKDSAVAVVADTWWRAKTALDALPIVWDEGPSASASSATIAEHLKEGLTATATNGERGKKGRGGLWHALPRPRDHGAHERHGEALGRQSRAVGADAERGSFPRGLVGGIRRAARQVRGLQDGPRRRFRPARRHAGLRAPGGGNREGVPGCPDQTDLEPRGGPGARFLPADLAVPARRRARRERQPDRPARARVRPIDQRHL